MMKRHILLFLLLLTASVACGQQQDICTHLQETGRVSILQDARLFELLGNRPKIYYAGGGKPSDASAQTMGYRIRVFSGNQQTSSKNRCYAIQKKVNELMPDLSTYVAFKTPNWRLSVGDYRTSEEASAMLYQLRKSFPEYSKEMFIVKEAINL